MGTGQSQKTLHYSIKSTGSNRDITLDLFEAEWYSAAVVVHPLVGNLVCYSNQGRYEPRLAESWDRKDPFTWTFKLRTGLKCENGEPITPEKFKTSIERSIRSLQKSGGSPPFDRLSGYSAFLSGAVDISGIRASDREIQFHFDRPVRNGLIEVLSFAPFGFICSENLAPDGSWKNKNRFISSGPYRVASLEIGKKYVLERNKSWAERFSKNAPDRVEISLDQPVVIPDGENWILDNRLTEGNVLPSGFYRLNLVPEYVTVAILGNLERGYFSKTANRKAFRAAIQKAKGAIPQEKWGRFHPAIDLYPNQSGKTASSVDNLKWERKSGHLDKPLVIEGTEPTPGATRSLAWQVIRNALEELNLPFRFSGNKQQWQAHIDNDFDIRISNPSIGGSVESWLVEQIFFSPLGPMFPDPTGKIRSSVDKFERDEIDEKQFVDSFQNQVIDDSAVLVIGNRGMEMFISPSIDINSVSPALNIMRFDQLELK